MIKSKASPIQLNETDDARNRRIMEESMKAKGFIAIRLQAQIQDPQKSSYVGLPGYSLTFKASSSSMVDAAFDAIEAALKRV